MAKLPIRIKPDALLETLVDVHFEADTPPELLLGDFARVLAPEYTYQPTSVLFDGLPLNLPLQVAGERVFVGQGLRIAVGPRNFVFNRATDHYAGWATYFGLIQQVLRRLHGTAALRAFSRVGVRYVNSLPGAHLNDQLSVQLPELSTALPTPATTYYRAEFADAPDCRVVLTLTDQQQVAGREGIQSLFDVDVIIEGEPATELADVFARIDRAHTREKEVFFGLLTKEYLDSLEPEYES